MNESWFFAGLASSFVNVEPPSAGESKTKIDSVPATEEASQLSSCKIFQTCASSPFSNQPAELTPEQSLATLGLQEQVLIFQYRGKFHAVNHECPHRSYPLSKGAIYDIEDFGIILSAGITCPKHGWAFDLHTGESDKGGYKMKLWDVEVRQRQQSVEESGSEQVRSVQEIWVRKKRQRSG